ncbi:ATP-dependent Clp protease proteolytic subunit [Actibacterium sp. 188UL27-1]|uniref:ATP-dependent Clp protease proteolytic subunit n=1 Tax=Actibacterium sp. 188UL27-1 TaxID=2786961 RepID=UPI00195BDC47|nr:ATP-dependent Clp protease proteolytic subunit [Actibacterium sp. 188UL27-1]MBM7068338.1 ATP-dependent Clp protease proteolytic subunit [Actibacterium sp. 188UL27-1]
MVLSARFALRSLLFVQLGVAAILLGQDFAKIAPSIRLPSFAPSPDMPIRPGDQTRRFDPRTMPRRPDLPGGTPMPTDIDMPARLFFEDQGDGVVLVTGTIQPGDADRFTDWLAEQDPQPETLQFHSPGGSVDDALAIGRAIRTTEVTTQMTAQAVCLSACPYMLMAGTERRVAHGAWVGVHQHYYGENTILPAFLAVEDIQQSQARVVAYLDEMEIDLRLMQHALSTPPSEIYLFVAKELLDYKVATEMTGTP